MVFPRYGKSGVSKPVDELVSGMGERGVVDVQVE